MALSLTMESFSVAEPMKKNRFLVQFQGKGGVNTPNPLTIACHSCSVPQLTITEKELHRFNDRVYVPGKGEFGTVDLEFYEYLKVVNESVDNKENIDSAGQVLWNWQKKVYDPSTGVAGYKKDISDNVLIAQFDGGGNVIRTWNLYYAWPTVVDFDSLDSTSDEIQNVKVTLRYDWASMGDQAVPAKPNTNEQLDENA